MSDNDDKKIQSINSIETYAYGKNEDIIHKKEEIKCINIIKNAKIINYDDLAKENISKHNPNWLQILDHS